MKIITGQAIVPKVIDIVDYDYFFSCCSAGLFIWFNVTEISQFLKYIEIQGYNPTFSTLYGNAPDMNNNLKRYYMGPFTTTLMEQLRRAHGPQKESISNIPSKTGNIQVETKK